MSDDLYWISNINSSWSIPSNWAEYSGGPTVSRIPTGSSKVYFDDNGIGNCSLDTEVIVTGFALQSGYTGTINQNGFLLASNEGNFYDGNVIGSHADMTFGGLTLAGTDFISTRATLAVGGNFSYSAGFFNHNDGTVAITGNGLIDTTSLTLILNDLYCDATFRLDGTISVERDLILLSGAISSNQMNSGDLEVNRDVTCYSAYNSWNPDNNVRLSFRGDTNQKLVVETGSVLPSIWLNKSISYDLITDVYPNGIEQWDDSTSGDEITDV